MSASSLRPSYLAHVARLQEGYERVLASHRLDAIVLGSGAAAARSPFDDQYWPLLPTPAFAHWVPLAEPDAFLVIRAGQRPRLLRTRVDDFWEAAPRAEDDHFWDAFELLEELPGHLERHLPTRNAVTIRRDAPLDGDPRRAQLLEDLDALRTRKSEYEVACLCRATERAAAGHLRAAELFAAGDPSELSLHLAYLEASAQDDSATPYKNIVALGAHAAVLHYVSYEARAPGRADQSLLVDAGAKVLGYGSDITRTHARGQGPAARRFAELIAAMDRLQRTICAEISIGLEYEALHDRSHQLLAELLLAVGLCRGSADELVARGVTRRFYPHGLGHSLGITVHDVGMRPRAPRPDNAFLRTTTTIEPDQVFTIEPGLYFIPQLLERARAESAELIDWAAVDELRPFGGIRIEDNLAIGAGGAAIRNLTRETLAAATR